MRKRTWEREKVVLRKRSTTFCVGYILTGVASGADRPLIVDENFVEWEIRNEKCEMVVRRIKIKSAAEF